MSTPASLLGQFIERQRVRGVDLPSATDDGAFAAVHHWSVSNPADFWEAVWRDAEIVADLRADGSSWDTVVRGLDRMAPPDPELGPTWFPGARLNYAENLLRHEGADPALIAWDERGRIGELSWDDLRREVARTAAGLRSLDVQPGDRVAGWLPNIPETIIAMLATASLGAVWTSCSPDFGVDGVVDRFGQTEPVVLICCDGYGYGGRVHDSVDRLPALLARLPSVRHAVVIPYRGGAPLPADPRVLTWDALRADVTATLRFARMPFDHPLAVLYSSGTTGLPKCMVHGAGGTLLQHLKEHRLHGDLRVGERIFYFTTCGWMMWNWLVGALAAGATLVLYDGAPLPASDPGILWQLAAAERVNVFGTSAKYLALAEKHALAPAMMFDLSSLRSVLSTGSPLSPESFDWVTRSVGSTIRVASISGGTDIVSCFVLGNPLQAIHRGEIQGPGLGMAVAVFDELGNECPVGEAGELVCTRPFPSMPVRFWNDADGSQYRAAYFATWPGVWRHGDWITRTPSGGFIISGRSDATLNPGGVRIGTAEIYRQVEAIPEILESVVIGQRIPGALDGDVRVVLFVRMRPGELLTPGLEEAIRRQVRLGASPHHVPRVILEVADIPRTRSGKLSELAVRDTVEGRPVKNVGALANPEALDHFRGRPELGSC
ncbi:MAG: acetoacetate--CoA ligase [Gemmatimonadota bacterium]